MGKFYEYRQNNSGGTFHLDKKSGLSVLVIFEADSAVEANHRAEDAGIYFDGLDTGRDCYCCGTRWDPLVDNEFGSDEPSMYRTPLSNKEEVGKFSDYTLRSLYPTPFGYIHYADGTKQSFNLTPSGTEFGERS